MVVALLTASAGDNYLWSTGETSSRTVSPTTTTVYTVTVTANGGCSATATVTVQQETLPISPTGFRIVAELVTVTPNVPGYTYFGIPVKLPQQLCR